MDDSLILVQEPAPGRAIVRFCGDCVIFTLKVPPNIKGHAWIRTDLGRASVARKEIIEKIDFGRIKEHGEWHDIKMRKKAEALFSIRLPLHETGRFQAKCFFLTENDAIPLWPVNGNTIINVEAPGSCCANIIYNAFVRQFGSTKYFSIIKSRQETMCLEELDKKGFTVIPCSGKFRDLAKEVDFIFSELGCRVLQLLPIHPTPTTYARMGRFGSPYAALNFTDVDPALAEFDPSATPMEQFMELADRVHFYSGYLILDIAINHTGWAAVIHDTHPEWLLRGEDGKIEVPGAWGVEWADLTRLDYSKPDLWQYMAEIFLFWCRRGVDGFRCDAGYMIPVAAWEYIISRVRQEYPDIVFFLEGLGGGIDATHNLLDRANFNWAYSELFQNYDKKQIENYLASAFDCSEKYGHMIHFAETHDNPRLASVSNLYAKMRTSISALFSVCGGFGFANGVEWFAKEKIDVHEANSLNWGSEENQVGHIKKLNIILKNHPCFADKTDLEFIHIENQNCLALLRYNRPLKKSILVLVNLDCNKNQTIMWNFCSSDTIYNTCPDKINNLGSDDIYHPHSGTINHSGLDKFHNHDLNSEKIFFYDLITEKSIVPDIDGNNFALELEPGEVIALTIDKQDVLALQQSYSICMGMPSRVLMQKLKTKALKIFTAFNGYGDVNDFDVEKGAKDLSTNPVEFCRSMNQQGSESKVVVWQWEKDIRRKIMVPPGFFLIVFSNINFRAEIAEQRGKSFFAMASEEGLAMGKDGFFAVFMPLVIKNGPKDLFLRIRVFDKKKTKQEKGHLLYLGNYESLFMNCCFTREEIVADPSLKLLATTKQGGMMRAAAWWARLESRYDALLAANLSKSLPEKRWMLLSRCRIWAEYQGYSRQLAPDCLEKFAFSYHCCGKWVFRVPTCEGSYFLLELFLEMDDNKNLIKLTIMRQAASNKKDDSLLPDEKKIKITILPDIENRSFHDTVKAWTGPETKWPASVQAKENGFIFAPEPDHCSFLLKISKGNFTFKPEWQYMVNHPLEAQRGLDPDSDLFTPGYFTASIEGNGIIVLTAKAETPGTDALKPGLENQNTRPPKVENQWENAVTQDFFYHEWEDKNKIPSFPKKYSLIDAALKSLDAFIVNRGQYQSVIAGYPWFLDWGRDSLIFCRALIEADKIEPAKNILRLFGKFEKNGTLPNMICGEDTGNRETSDAVLWFFASCREITEKEGYGFLDELLEKRSVREILFSIARSLISGTDTGICMDKETSLIFSPSHFTWMDTNYPAGSPRQGYPVEIQALWHYALKFLETIDLPENKDKWKKLAQNVQKSVIELFFLEDKGFFSDCLHCDTLINAAKAKKDDALRPNQLFLITLGLLKDDDSVNNSLDNSVSNPVNGSMDEPVKNKKLLKNQKICQDTLESCMELLVPGAIRSLADKRLSYPVNIMHKDELLKDPHYIYSGKYKGDEDRERKPAYHNGTAWTWLFPVFCEAWAEIFKKNGKNTALTWLGSSLSLMETGCAGYIPEILDGDFPHCPRGCDAQAWGSSELARVLLKLTRKQPTNGLQK